MASTTGHVSLVDHCEGLFGSIGRREVIDRQGLGGDSVCSGAIGLKVTLDLEGAKVHGWEGAVRGRLDERTIHEQAFIYLPPRHGLLDQQKSRTA